MSAVRIMLLRVAVLNLSLFLFGCGERSSRVNRNFSPRQEVEIVGGIQSAPTAKHSSTARRVVDSVKYFENSGIWMSEVKFPVLGRECELWVSQSGELDSEAYVQRLAKTLSVVDELKPQMEVALWDYYNATKGFVEETFWKGLVPEVSNSNDLWDLFDFRILEYYNVEEQIAAKMENREPVYSGLTFKLLGSQPGNEEDGTKISVRGGKIVVDSDASIW